MSTGRPLVGLLYHPAVPGVLDVMGAGVDFVEVIPDRLWYDFGVGAERRFSHSTAAIDELRRHARGRAVIGHGIGLSLPSAMPLDEALVDEVVADAAGLEATQARIGREITACAPGAIADAKAKPVGTGPFRFVRWNKGDRLEIEQNPDHWNAVNIKLNKATFRFIPDAAATVAALLAGDIDASPNTGAGDALDRLKADPKLKVVVGNTEGETILAMNNKKAPLDDVRVRRAISHAIDRKAIIIGAAGGTATPIGSHFSPNHPAYVDLTGAYPYDPAKAKALLAEAGKTNLTLSLRLPPPAYAQRGGELIAAMLEQVGVKAQIEQLQFPQWLEQVFKNKQFDLTIISHTEPMDINIYADPNYYFQYGKPEFKTLIDLTVSAGTDEIRNKAFGDAQRMLATDAVNGFLFMLPKTGVWNAKLEGLWENSPVQANDLTEVRWVN